MEKFDLVSPYQPRGDQPAAIEKITNAMRAGVKYQCLLGVTGSGKTFTMANVIANLNRPTHDDRRTKTASPVRAER